MKIMIASDIHGSASYCELLINAFVREGAQKLLLLGDILYHGPRNDLPDSYNPKAVAKMLNGMKDKILCVRGNCDCEVDQMVLEFPILAEYIIFYDGGRAIYATHGHKAVQGNLPVLNGDVLLCGHTHVPAITQDEYVCLNPGSVSIPKQNSPHSYMTLSDGVFEWKTLDGEVFNSYTLND